MSSSNNNNNNNNSDDEVINYTHNNNDDTNDNNNNNDNDNDSIDEQYEAKVKHWKDSPFAVGLVNVKWEDDQQPCCGKKKKKKKRYSNNHTSRDRDDDGHLCCSAYCCSWLGADRVGNMAILAQTKETYYEEIEIDNVDVDVDEENNNNNNDNVNGNNNNTKTNTKSNNNKITQKQKKRIRYRRPKLLCVVGPYWPVTIFITYPLIIGISLWTAFTTFNNQSLPIIIVWCICTVLLLCSLAMVACCDPGILYRYNNRPTIQQTTNPDNWRWNDQARTYRPPKARYDPECAVVVEGFDHTCPWTGTAIGAKNFFWFKVFVFMVPICIVFSVVLHLFF